MARFNGLPPRSKTFPGISREHPACRRGGAAFTLIELLAVIAVIGILASLLIVAFRGIRQAADRTQTAANLRELVNATKLWSQDNDGLMPDSQWYASRTKIRAGSDFERDWSLHTYLEIPRNREADEGPTAFTCIASDRIVEGSGDFRRSISINHFTGIRSGDLMGIGPVRMRAVQTPSRMMLYTTGILLGYGYRSSVHPNLDSELFLYPYDGKNMVAFVDGSVSQLTEEAFKEKIEENFRDSSFWVGVPD